GLAVAVARPALSVRTTGMPVARMSETIWRSSSASAPGVGSFSAAMMRPKTWDVSRASFRTYPARSQACHTETPPSATTSARAISGPARFGRRSGLRAARREAVTAEVRRQRLGNEHAAVRLLVVLEQSDEG